VPDDGATVLPEMIGRYEIIRLIGEGAMGRVLLAHDPVLDRHVAVKHLRDDLQIPDDVQDGLMVRMRHEARAAARVTHPNLVTLHDMGEAPDFGIFLVFEYVEGPNLKELISQGAVAPKRVARMARELGAALRFAHDAGVLHRDIKPENVILSATGAKLADFGIARIPDSTLTHRGGLLGTPAYSAPETFKHGEFSPESDQFSLAATLFEAVTGKRAFPGDDAVAVAAKIAHDEPERMARNLGLSAEVEDVLRQAMSKSPRERYESCETFGLTLVGALTGIRVPGLAQPPSSVRPPSQAEPQSGPASGAPPRSVPPSPESRPPASQAPESRSPQSQAPEPAAVPFAKTSEFPASPLAQTSGRPPPRKTWQVLVGGFVVLGTAGLLVHTALRDSAPETSAPPLPSAAPTASAVTSAAAPTESSPVRPAGRPRATPPVASPSASASADPAAGGGGLAEGEPSPSPARNSPDRNGGGAKGEAPAPPAGAGGAGARP